MRGTLKIIATPTLAALVVTILCAAKPIEQPKPPDEMIWGGEWGDPNSMNVPAEQMAFSTESRSMYEAEGNYYLSLFNEGWMSMLQVFVWKYGPMRGWGSYALVISPEGKRYWAKHQFNEKQVKVVKDHLKFSEGGSMLNGKNGVFRIKLNYQNFQCDLTYKNNVPTWRPGNGYAYYDSTKKLYEFTVVSCPWADVTGTIKLPDRTLTVNGEGYSDKAISTLPPTKHMAYLYSIRAFSPPGTPKEDRWMFGMLEKLMHPSYGSKRVPFIYLCHNDKIIVATKNYDFEPGNWKKGMDTPYDYPTRIKIHAKDRGYIVEGEYVCGQMFDFLDIFMELPAVARKIAEKFLKRPVIFRSHGTFTGTVTSPDGKRTQIKLIGPTEYVVAK